MNRMSRLVTAAAVVAALAAISGCGEKDQVVVYQQGKYQGKPDTRPWDDDPAASLYTTSKWTPGDRGSWEKALRARAQAQNEYVRIGG